MGKLNIHPSPNAVSLSEIGNTEYVSPPDSLPKPSISHKRGFEVVDASALHAAYPQFLKLVPDYAKIRQALKLGLQLPGVDVYPSIAIEE